MMGMNSGFISMYVCVFVWLLDTLKQTLHWGERGNLIEGLKAKDRCLFSSRFSMFTLTFQSLVPLNKRGVRKACLQQKSFSNSKDEPSLVRSKPAAIQATRNWSVDTLDPILDLSSCGARNHVTGCRDKPSSPARERFSPSAKLPETVAPGERRPANLPWDRRGQGKGWAVTPAPPTTAERRSTAPSCSLYWWLWCFRTKHTLFLLKYFPPSSRKAAFPPSRHSWFLQSLTTAGQHVFKDNCFV